MNLIKFTAIILSISFSILHMPDLANSLTLPKQLSGTLQAGGTDFDEFVTHSEDFLSLEKSNPRIKLIYQNCGYGEKCDILAYVEGDIITEISNAYISEKHKQNSNATNNVNSKKHTESITQQNANDAKSSGYPAIKGINLGMSYIDAKEAVSQLPIPGEARASIFVYPEGRDTRSFIFFPPALKSLYSINTIDMDFLKKFINNYKLKGKQINFEKFSHKFMTNRERDKSVYGLFTPISFFGGLFGYSDSTIFWDCGNFCVVLAPDGSKGHSSYIGFTKIVDHGLSNQPKSRKETTFD